MKKINFTKMHGIGNDYIYINCLDNDIKDPSKLAIMMSSRRYSVGADGVVLICKSEVADAKMRMFNADGSEGKMCGNAIRCVGKYLYDNGITDKKSLSIETLSGIKYLELFVVNGKVDTVKVDMGLAIIDPKEIPVIASKSMINKKVIVNEKPYFITAVSMGNPHAVIFLDEIDNLNLEKIGPSFENLDLFPERVNTEFVKVIDRKTLKMRVWERGSGETHACGTGSCATVVAAILNGYCDYGENVTVKLIGGELNIVCNKDMKVFMTGKATKVYDGVYEYEDKN